LRDRLGHNLDLLRVLTAKELKLRYRGTLLGVLWSLAHPLALALVLHFAMKIVVRLDIENYALFLLSALFPWQWLANSLGAATITFTYNGGLIRKLAFARHMLCSAVVLGDLAHFAVTIPLFVAFRMVAGLPPMYGDWLLGLPTLLLIQAATVLGCVMVIATTNAFLRDIEQLVRLALLLLFYATPIFYPLSMVPESLTWVILSNPFAPMIICWRSLLLEGSLEPLYLGMALGYAIVLLAVGTAVYSRVSWRLAEVV
jgi:lipopolysaccharide transport system permease protein